MHLTSRAFAGLATMVVALTFGCGSSSPSSSAPPPTVAPSPTPPPVVVTASATVGGSAITILTDSKGMTLYYFTPDKGGKVTCKAGCLALWPPLILPADQSTPTGGPGVTGALTTITNPDGKGNQVMYNSWPLYYFVKDKSPGDVTGEKIAGEWFVVPPTLAAGG